MKLYEINLTFLQNKVCIYSYLAFSFDSKQSNELIEQI